ncbi:RHS repeat domain-containing protein [Parafilimonas terrae]|uniref:RHS repeat domain-containing protein n=1 Tax=Parafilimonas terrae TaxID=1465490 RepID=UPI0015A5196B|nr:RHS repeat-associated core domain-containing protein [Parafilimonas terrae]
MSYRYGFNGKEKDNEVKGEGNQYDYGFRIYDPRAVRFLSIDPLTKHYPAWSPYPFAMNNPVSGVDLDGLEYLYFNEARIEVMRGGVFLKIENMHNITQNAFKQANSDPNNWSYDQFGHKGIGISTEIGSINLQKYTPNSEADYNATDNSPGAPEPDFQPGQTQVQNPTAKSTGLPDKRYKDRTVSSATPAGSRGLALASIAIDAIIVGSNISANYLVNDDINLAKKHIEILKQATYDVQTALNEGLVPQKYLTDEFISDIINVVLSGVSNLNNKDISNIGRQIYNTVSKRRMPYDGQIIMRDVSGQVIKSIPKPNPIYDPNYGKTNNSASQSEKKPVAGSGN